MILVDNINKHVPRDSLWFSDRLSDIIRERNLAQGNSRKSKSHSDGIRFRYLRNRCFSMIRKAKSHFYVKEMCDTLKNPSKFWLLNQYLRTCTKLS